MFMFIVIWNKLISYSGWKKKDVLAVTSCHFIREIPMLHSLLAPINKACPLCVM